MKSFLCIKSHVCVSRNTADCFISFLTVSVCSRSWPFPDHGLSFDSKSADQVPKNQNWWFGLFKEIWLVWVLILRLVTWHQLFWQRQWRKIVFHATLPLALWQLSLSQGSNRDLASHKFFSRLMCDHKSKPWGWNSNNTPTLSEKSALWQHEKPSEVISLFLNQSLVPFT